MRGEAGGERGRRGGGEEGHNHLVQVGEPGERHRAEERRRRRLEARRLAQKVEELVAARRLEQQKELLRVLTNKRRRPRSSMHLALGVHGSIGRVVHWACIGIG